MPRGARPHRLRPQRPPARPRRFLRQARRPRHLLVLEARGGTHRALARNRGRLRRAPAAPHRYCRKESVMHGFWLLVHVLGVILWLGGGLATMVLGVTAKQFTPRQRLAAYRLTSAIQRNLLWPGAAAGVV